jgi:hypothetical protein
MQKSRIEFVISGSEDSEKFVAKNTERSLATGRPKS